MEKSADAYRSIGEVAKLIGVAPHVLRYWETQFPQLAPTKRADGRRYYRLDDVRLAAGLVEVMREEGLTTKGAARLIAQDRGAALRLRGAKRLPPHLAGNLAAGTHPAEAAQDLPGSPDKTGKTTTTAEARRDSASPRPTSPSGSPQQADTATPSRRASAPIRRGDEDSPQLPLFATPSASIIPSSGAWLARLAGLAEALRRPAAKRLRAADLHVLAEQLRAAQTGRA